MRKVNRLLTLLTLLISVLTGTKANSQTLQEWAKTVNWDGVSHWSKYIVTTAAHMGANALPVPTMGNGSIDSITYAGTSFSYHTMKGDRSQDISLHGNYCIVKNHISADISFEPVEFYQTSDTVKKQRHVYYQNYYDNKARGDVHLNFNIKILRKLEDKVQLVLRVGYRYPASSGLASARYTDGMGYHFDISWGKPLSKELRLIGMAGFLCWQMNGDGHRQNDAFLFGSGLEWNKNGWRFQGYGAGYLGYMHNSGDKPIVVRAWLEKRYNKMAWLLHLQQGVNDYKYTTAEAGVKFFINNKWAEKL
ncbi:MAG: transporter [Chitinophagaceae bacterium]